MVLPPPMQSSLPAGWLAFTGRELNPLDCCKRFQIIHPPFLDLAWRKGSFMVPSQSGLQLLTTSPLHASLCRVQRPPIAASAHEPARHRAGVLAALEDRNSGDEGGLVAVDTLHEAAPAGRHVVNQLRLVEPQPVKVDQVDVGAQPGREPAAVGEAEEIGGLAG